MSKPNLGSLLGDGTIDFECPGCKHTFFAKFKNVYEEGKTVICPNCTKEIDITHDDSAKTSFKNADKDLSELNKTLKSLSKMKW